MEYNKVYLQDSLSFLKMIEDKSIDLVCCDLPYYGVVKDDWDNQWDNEEDYLTWIYLLICEYNRILKDNSNIFLFTSRQYNRKISLMLDDFFNEKRIIIWVRKRMFNNTRGKALSSNYEPISFYSKGNEPIFNNIKIKKESKRKEYNEGTLMNGITLSDVWDDVPALPHNSKEKVKHPTQKPIKLIERIINLSTNENDIVLDNCCGSGTTLVAAKKLNRKYIGCDNKKEYIDLCNLRLNNN